MFRKPQPLQPVQKLRQYTSKLYGSTPPKGPSRTVFSTESDSVVFYYSVVNLLRIVIHYSKDSKSVQNIVIHYIFSSESVRVVNSLQIVNSLRVLFLVCRGPLGPPICIGVLSWLLSFEERETLQYASHLYGSTPPICTAVLLEKYWGLGSPERF